MDKLFNEAKEPNEDKRKGLKGHEKLPNDPASQRKLMLLALDDTPVKTIYEKMGVLYDPTRHTGRAVDAWMEQRFTGRKRSGKNRKMYMITPPWTFEPLRKGKPLGHREKVGIAIAVKHGLDADTVAHWVFRPVSETRHLMDEIRGFERIRENALFANLFQEPNQ